MTKPRLQVQTMKTSDLILYARNAKQHPEEQVAVWHDKDGTPVIVEGHGRVPLSVIPRMVTANIIIAIIYETIVYPLITRHVIKWAKTLD